MIFIFSQYSIYSVLLTIAYFYWAINILQVLQFLFITKLLWSFSLCKHFESPLLLSSSFLSLCKRFFNTDRLQSLFITVLLCLFAQLVACAFSVPKPLHLALVWSTVDLIFLGKKGWMRKWITPLFFYFIIFGSLFVCPISFSHLFPLFPNRDFVVVLIRLKCFIYFIIFFSSRSIFLLIWRFLLSSVLLSFSFPYSLPPSSNLNEYL